MRSKALSQMIDAEYLGHESSAKRTEEIQSVQRAYYFSSEHRLVSNCVSCGRIICEYEGMGTCSTCGNDLQIQCRYLSKIVSGCNLPVRKSRDTPNGLNTARFLEALRKKNDLLLWSKCAFSSRIIDDDMVFSLLTTGNQASANGSEDSESELTEASSSGLIRVLLSHTQTDDSCSTNFGQTRHPPTPPPKAGFLCRVRGYIPVVSTADRNKATGIREKLRIQDSDLQFMSDEGMCLTVHQPYASLIIAGIKQTEGRDWYTSFRGKLWIRSSTRKAPAEEIREAFSLYHVAGDSRVLQGEFPTGCLLGCVDIIDCITQDEYRLKYATGELGTEFIFLLKNPRELFTKIPVKGGVKIFQMKASVHGAAKKFLRMP